MPPTKVSKKKNLIQIFRNLIFILNIYRGLQCKHRLGEGSSSYWLTMLNINKGLQCTQWLGEGSSSCWLTILNTNMGLQCSQGW